MYGEIHQIFSFQEQSYNKGIKNRALTRAFYNSVNTYNEKAFNLHCSLLLFVTQQAAAKTHLFQVKSLNTNPYLYKLAPRTL